MPPLVSVCIPSYNAERTIERCLRSVLAQDLADAEIVLLDNYSTDQTLAIAGECLADFPGARVIRNDHNLGRVPNWNRCFEEARGQFVKFAFTNDVLRPGALQHLLHAIRSDKTCVMAVSRQQNVNSMPAQPTPLPDDIPVTTRGSADTLVFFARHGFLTGSLNGRISQRACVVENGIRFRGDIPYFADFLHALELSAHGRTAFLDAETYYFDEGAQGRYHFVGLQVPGRFFLEHRVCTNRHIQLLDEQGRNGRQALNYLIGRYFWYLTQGSRLSPWDAWRVFNGYPALQLQVAAKTLWFHSKHTLFGS